MASILTLVSLLVVNGISAAKAVPLSDIDPQLKSFWFHHISSTITTINAALDYDNQITRNNTNDCHKHFQELITGALRGELWANQMIDSMGRPGSGIMKMSLSYLGSFSECVDTKSPNFRPKYCLATINIPKSESNFFKQKLSVKMGTCVPSSCATEDIARIINRYSAHLIHNSSAYVNNCHEKDENVIEEDLPSVLVLCLFGVLLVLVIAGTLCDHITADSHSQMELLAGLDVNSNSQKKFESYENPTKSILYEILIAFSLKTNAKKIFETKRVDNSIQVFHGIRVLAMIWIISGHSAAFAAQWMNFRNPMDMTSHNLMSQVLVNGTFSVDCFFFISGFLVSYLALKKKTGAKFNRNLVSFYVHRYLRMTPSMMAVIAFSATLLPYVASGPQWTESIIMFNGWCRNNWWINSLYLHNFVNTGNMCLSHSWYSAVDMQLYLVSPIILIPLYLKPMLGIAIAIFLLITSMTITAVLTVLKEFPAVPYFNDLIEQQVMDQYYGWIYIKPYCRVGPYLVGILLAYFINSSRGNLKIRRFHSIIGWLLTFVVGFLVIFSMFWANNGDIPGVYVAALYSATSRTTWALCMAWITYACMAGSGGLVNVFLSAKIWIPLSRLTYCAYLVHPIVMAALYGSREQTFDFSSYLMTYFTISHLLVTYAVSLVLSLLVESPLVAISKLLIARKT